MITEEEKFNLKKLKLKYAQLHFLPHSRSFGQWCAMRHMGIEVERGQGIPYGI